MFDIIVLVLGSDDEMGSNVVIDGFIFRIFLVEYVGSVGLESGGSVIELIGK